MTTTLTRRFADRAQVSASGALSIEDDGFATRFLAQAAASIDWAALTPWIDALDARSDSPAPLAFYKVHLLAHWLKLDAASLEDACLASTALRAFIGAPLHGPIVDLRLYRQYAGRFVDAGQALGKLVAAIELQLIDRGLLPPTEALRGSRLQSRQHNSPQPTIVVPQRLRPVAQAQEPIACRVAAQAHETLPSCRALAVLVWPWGDVTMVDHRIAIGRDSEYSSFANHLRADGKISRRHATVEPTETGVNISDMGSSNGTYVDDQPLGYAGSRIVPHDTVLKLGTDLAVELVFIPA